MKVLHLLSSGGIGGIEVLCKDMAINSTWENYFCFAFSAGQIADEMSRLGVQLYFLHGKRKLSIEKLKNLLKIVKNISPDIITIHFNNIYLQSYYIILKKLFPNIKYVMMVHTVFERKYYYCKGSAKNMLKKILLSQTIKSSDKIISVSEAGKTSYQREFNIPPEKMSVIYNGIGKQILEDGKRNEPNKTFPLKILYVGRLTTVKGVNLLIEVFSRLHNQYNITLTIVGDGPQREEYEKLAKNLGIIDAISFEGFQRNVQVYFEKASIFVYPSTWEEIFGISMVEAMAYGLPCVSNRRGGIPEIIQDGYNGFLSEDATVEELYKAINRAIDLFDNGCIQKVSDNAKRTAEKFSILNTVNNFKVEYTKLLS